MNTEYDFKDDFVALQDENARLRTALALAIRQNSHDMLLTGEELRMCERILGKGMWIFAEVALEFRKAVGELLNIVRILKTQWEPSSTLEGLIIKVGDFLKASESESIYRSERIKEIAARLSHSGYDQERDELIDLANSIREHEQSKALCTCTDRRHCRGYSSCRFLTARN